MHQHDHCQHELKLCNQCGIVYCVKCGKEWGTTWAQDDYTYIPFYPTYPYPYTPYIPQTGDFWPTPPITWATTTDSSDTQNITYAGHKHS